MIKKPKVCLSCEHVGPTKKYTRGSFWIEVVLWLCYIIPGVLYSLWRLSTRTEGCASCGSSYIVPVDSPRGQEIINKKDKKQ